ncbi:MAG: DNA-formamidopyrimidine glycosylase [Candidatus Bruticola sp.]
MPELPEVETIRRGLEDKLPGLKVEKILVKLPKLLKNVNSEELNESLRGQTFTAVRRLGKILILDIGVYSVLVRLGMTGQLTFRSSLLPDTNEFYVHPVTGLQRAQGQFVPDKHTHVIVDLNEGYSLCYRDIRQFGKWYLYKTEELENSPELKALGPDPFGPNFTEDRLALGLKKTSRAVKTALLDQSIVAGLGNIYADEVLFASRVNPEKPAKELSSAEIRAIFTAIKPILQQSINNRGTTFSDYRDADGNKGSNAEQLKVYGRGGQPCLVCGSELVKKTIGGRSCVCCPSCQVIPE